MNANGWNRQIKDDLDMLPISALGIIVADFCPVYKQLNPTARMSSSRAYSEPRENAAHANVGHIDGFMWRLAYIVVLGNLSEDMRPAGIVVKVESQHTPPAMHRQLPRNVLGLGAHGPKIPHALFLALLCRGHPHTTHTRWI